jgi:hypothetical protein
MQSNYWERFIVGIVCTVAVLSPRAAAAQSNPGDAHKQLTTLTVKKGKTAFMFHIYGVETSDQMSMEKTLAGSVLAKM